MDQVAMAMENIKEASQQNVTSMRQLEMAAQTLKDIGHKFTESVGRYKV
jgi:methyl-accepting chemotaxis protein